MQYSDSIDKAQDFSAKALKRLQKEDLPPTPESYELWYVYYSGANAEVTRAVDVLEAAGQKITLERCQEIHQRFLSHNRQSEEVKRVGGKIDETIKDVTGVVVHVQDAAAQYSVTLSDVTQKIDGDLTELQLQSLLRDVADGTENMISQNTVLAQKLEQSSQAMLNLQRDLEVARQEALTDGLTGLSNRKAFDAEFERAFFNARENGEAFSLIMMDIDHFKIFNDNYGHQVGDQVLRLVAKTLVDGVKGRDMVARYGGEEFMLILPNTDLKGAEILGNNLRNAVAGKAIVNRNSGETLGRITLSGGAVEYSDGDTMDGMMERVDRGLYEAKNDGRNQIVPMRASDVGKKVS